MRPTREPVDPAPGLTGVWTTSGIDETFGAVEVEMALEADGSLSMVLLLASGGRRTFPRTWELDADELVLRGAYFTPDGESRVRWRMRCWCWKMRRGGDGSGGVEFEPLALLPAAQCTS